jgi:maleylpyruvate isomerase
MKLYEFFPSSASYRVRIALNLKGLAYQSESLKLYLDPGPQFTPEYRKLNPQGLVPTLVDKERVLQQSLAILEYLEEIHPEPPLLPGTVADRARIRALALVVACEIHPLDNLRVLKHLTGPMGLSQETMLAWYRHWIATGLSALEAMVANDPRTGAFCHGESPTLADVCLVPQLYNARRYKCPLDDYPSLRRIDEACLKLGAFERARPENQPDYEPLPEIPPPS